MAQSEVIRVGIVGCGGQGHAFARSVLLNDTLQLVACADPDRAAANRVAALASDVSTHPSVEALLAERDVDAIVVATPHHLLGPVALAAVRAGKHVLAEKPIALNARSAAEIETAVAQAGVCYMSGYSFRFGMAQPVHDLLAMGAVGEIRAITGAIGTAPFNDGWSAYPETGGGPLLYVGSHLVDLYLWFVNDEPEVVWADVTQRHDTGADDTAVFQLRFARGILAQGFVTQTAPGFFFAVTIHGHAGQITLRGHSFLQYEIEVVSRALQSYATPTVIRPVLWGDLTTTMLVPELAEFAAAIREQRPPAITVSSGRRVLQVLDAIRDAGRSGQSVLAVNRNHPQPG